jgi:ADP-ribosylglycohydrolase
MALPPNYEEKVYAGVLGKIIGVYLGRPVEQWTYEKIAEVWGDVDHYLPGKGGGPLIATDDDITGTFTFLRALEDEGYSRDLTPEQIGNNWLNYTIERKTIFWWGGMGNSTEHTAYERLKSGIKAPLSGAIATNGKVIAEQIGAQIFIDGWAMVAPGDPEFAVDLARRAASVSHDGEAIYGAQVVAAIESLAFVETDINKLIDCGVSLIPADSDIARVIHDVREWHAKYPDWRKGRELIAANYGYDKFVGPCHMVPNHALVIHALLYGDGDFQKSQIIVNTAGWDTDCNAANVGCVLGIRGGLEAIDVSSYDWRGPIADRMYLSTADGSRGITDALTEATRVVNAGRALAGEAPIAPKNGAKFHFSLPSSVQGFEADPDGAPATITNEAAPNGERWLVVRAPEGTTSEQPARALTLTFMPIEAAVVTHYALYANPTIYPGQVVEADLAALTENATSIEARMILRYYTGADEIVTLAGPSIKLDPGVGGELEWQIPDLGGLSPLAIGIEVLNEGAVALDRLTWGGAPTVSFHRPENATGELWRRSWVAGVDHFEARFFESFRVSQNQGRGILSQGTRDWADYRVEATIVPYLAKNAGIAARVQGLRRYYALLLGFDGIARIVKMDDTETVLAEAPVPFDVFKPYALSLEVNGDSLTATIDGATLIAVADPGSRLTAGGVGLVIEEGTLGCEEVSVNPI